MKLYLQFNVNECPEIRYIRTAQPIPLSCFTENEAFTRNHPPAKRKAKKVPFTFYLLTYLLAYKKDQTLLCSIYRDLFSVVIRIFVHLCDPGYQPQS